MQTIRITITTGNSPSIVITEQNLQKLADGEPLSGRSRAEDDFTTAG